MHRMAGTKDARQTGLRSKQQEILAELQQRNLDELKATASSLKDGFEDMQAGDVQHRVDGLVLELGWALGC